MVEAPFSLEKHIKGVNINIRPCQLHGKYFFGKGTSNCFRSKTIGFN
jgi:hypothetical protein